MIILAAKASHGETVTYIVIGILGVAISLAVHFVPGVFDAATRARLRMQNMNPDNQRALERDRQRRRFIALILGVGSTVVLAQGLTQL